MLSLRYRRIIYAGFIVLFIITAPLLVLYSAGWRYNFTKQTIVKVGSLSVKPFPTDATVLIDGVVQTDQRTNDTLRVTGLWPGQYTVTIRRDGYSDWEKHLPVYSSTNTFVDHAVLWKQSTPELITPTTIVNAWPAPNQKTSAGLAKGVVQIINHLNSTVSTVTTSQPVRALGGWSADSSSLLAQFTSGQWTIIAPNTNTEAALATMFSGLVASLNWSLDDPYILYVRSGNNWHQVNIVTKQSRVLLALPSQSGTYGQHLVVSKNIIYTTRTTATGGTFIERWLIGDNGTTKGPERVWQLPDRGNYRFDRSANGTIILLAGDTQKIAVTDPEFKQTLFAGDAKNYQWSTDGQKLLIYTDFEIGFYYPATGTTELITRYGTTIDRVAVFPEYEYLAVLTDNKLTTVELDDRDHRTTTTLLTGQPLTDFWLNQDGHTAVVVGTINDQAGTWKLPLQD